MRWMRRYAAMAASVAMAALTSGCPSPVLSVSPGAVNLTPVQSSTTIRISNTGSGTLTWEVQESLPWLTATQLEKQDSASGATSSDPSIVELSVDRSALPIGVTRGDVTVVSNGGTAVVPVSVEKTGPAELGVSVESLDFGASSTQQTFLITNRGFEALTWQIAQPANAPWLAFSPRSGTITAQNTSETISVTVNRAAQPAGDFNSNLAITSNGGNDNVAISMAVIPFSVTPSSLAFGVLSGADSDPLTIRNNGPQALQLNYSATTDDGANWLTLSQGSNNVAAGGQAQLTVTADPDALPAGSYTGSVRVTNGQFTVNVPVTMEASSLTVAPELIDFGSLVATDTRDFTVTNLIGEGVAYTISIPAADAAWLSVAPTGGNVTATNTHTLTANPANVEPGQYETQVTVNYPGGSTSLTVRMAKPRPARLVAVSENINFGTTGVEENIDIWNDGLGVIDWSIDTAGFPAWLVLIEAGVGGTANGTVEGDNTDTVTLRVDRSLAPAGTFDFSHSFQVVGSGAFNGAVTINVSMTVPQIPEIEIIADGVDNAGIPFINIDVSLVSKTFIIRNNGNGVLDWNFIQTQIPFWISSITPSQGGVNPGSEQAVTVTVDRSQLNFLGAQVQLGIVNNDPDVEAGFLPFIVEVQVPKRVAITARPGSLAFGPDESIGFIEIANDGDPGTELFYRVTSSKESWLKVFPANGSSIGTEANIKDFKLHTVAIVRSELEGSGNSGRLIIEAIQTNSLGQVEVVPDVAPFEINVSVEAAELTFQNARPRLRVPSMARFVMLMRNVRFSPIPIAETRLSTIADRITLFEDDREVEISETAKIAKGPRFIRGNMLLLLDYSNSMQEAARSVSDPAISGASDPLQALYEQTITQLLAEIPDNYRVGLAIFSERSGTGGSGVPRDALRPIYGTALESPATESELFLDDRTLLQQRLANIVVGTNGATELYPALREASRLIVEEDNIVGIFPYDDADDRIILCVTDGRTTTPPGEVTDITDQLAIIDLTRAFVIGWGSGVSTGPLVQLATETGGHVYSTNTETVVSGSGVTQVLPLVSELENYCVTDEPDPCDLSVKRDLEAQYLFSYVSLTEEGNVEIEGRLTFDDPNDQASECLPEQGEINGKFTAPQTQLNLYAGDPRLGQVKLIYGGLQPGNTGQVTVYLDSAVRDLTRFSFQLGITNANALQRANIQLVPRTEGGLIADWNVSGGGLTFNFESPDGTPLTFGDFGPLFTIDVSGVLDESLLTFNVLAPVINTLDPNSKYITAPDSIRLDTGPFTATSFARPSIELATINGLPADPSRLQRDDEDRLFFDLGTDVNTFTLNYFNRGGSHTPTDVDLQFTVIPNTQGIVRAPNGIDPDFWAQPVVSSTLAPQNRLFIVDRTTPVTLDGRDPETDFEIDIEYALRGIGYTGNFEPLYLRLEVSPPALSVSTNAITFPVGTDAQSLTVTNAGQGILDWQVDPDVAFPSWLSANRVDGSLAQGAQDTLILTVDRTGQLPGSTQNFVLRLISENETTQLLQSVTLTLEN